MPFDETCYDEIDPFNQRTFACQDHDLELHGCGVGCVTCDHSAGMASITGVTDDGRRWARPHPNINYDGRDAYGKIRALESNVPILIPPINRYELGVCYDNWGQECFDYGICECIPEPSTTVGPDCPAGTLVQGLWPDCYLMEYITWPPNIWCRRKFDHYSHGFAPFCDNLQQMQEVRAGRGPCTSSWLSICTGALHITPGCAYGWPDPEFSYYIDSSQYGGAGLYDTMGVSWENPQLLERIGPDNTTAYQALRAAQNAILARVIAGNVGGVNFDQAEHPFPPDGVNYSVGKWWREFVMPQGEWSQAVPVYSSTGEPYFIADLVLPDGSVEALPLDLVIHYARLEISFFPYRMREANASGGVEDDMLWPSVRIKLRIKCGLRLVTQPQTPGVFILQHVVTGRMSPTSGTLVLKNWEGVRMSLPYETVWKGGTAAIAGAEWEEILDRGYWAPSTDWGRCCRVAMSFNNYAGGGYPVPAWTTKIEERVSTQYSGAMRMRWPKTTGWCP